MSVTSVHQVQSLIGGRRRSLGWTQQQVADLAGVSRKWVSEFERGATVSVELPLLLRVLDALELSLEIVPVATSVTEPERLQPEVDLDQLLTQYRERGARGPQ